MRLSRKIFFPIGLLIFSLLAIFSVGFVLLYNQRNTLDEKLAEGEILNSLVHELDSLHGTLESIVMSQRFEQRPVASGKIQDIESRIGQIIEEIRRSSSSPVAHELVQRVIDSRENLSSINQELLAASIRGNPRDIERSFIKWSTKIRATEAAISDLASFNLATVQRSATELDKFVSLIFVTLVIISVASIFMAAILSLYFRNIITLPIEELSGAADMVADKQFDFKINIHSNDELGRLARVFRDMADRVKAYYEHLENEIRKKDEFIGIASHELKTPLTSLKIYIQVLHELAKKRGHAEYSQHFEKISAQSDKLNELVSNLLDIARIEGGRIAFEKESFDLNMLVKATVEEIQAAHGSHDIKIEGYVDEPAFGDKERIGQVITNLLSNAIKYSPAANKVVVRLFREDREACIEVEDFGVGIEPKHHSHLFDKFFRVHENDKITFPGMGVGLYISSSIVKQHGGSISVKSTVGKGSVFSFTLPLAV